MSRRVLIVARVLLFTVLSAGAAGWVSSRTSSRSSCSNRVVRGQQGRDDMDLLDYFDPLLSPHSYPNGIDANKNQNRQRPAEQSVHSKQSPQKLSLDFDPTISPHSYPRGTDAGPDTGDIIGILLIDHGSRRESSNQQLQLLAQRYQQRLPHNYRVYASHMELAQPTIQQGIEYLSKIPGISTILCHPYFLSPGRHVTEDVPQLIQQACLSLEQRVQFIKDSQQEENVKQHDTIHLYLTQAVGSDMDQILQVVDDSIQKTLQFIRLK